MPDREEGVIQKAIRGDTRSFRELVEQLQPLGYSVAFRFVGDAGVAEDILQESFVKLWKHLPEYRKEIRLSTWFYRIVTNQALDYVKSRQGKAHKRKVDLDEGWHVKSDSTPETDFQRGEFMQIVYQLAGELSPTQQAVFILRDLEALTGEEVAEIMSLSAGAIKSNLFLARRAIREKLHHHYQGKPFVS